MKKLTKEDTWKTDELKKHIRGYEEDSIRRGEKMRRSEDERRHRSGASLDRRHRDRDREERRDGEKLKEREQKERTKHREPERDRDLDRRREDSREKMDERNERERDRRKDREKDRGADTDRYRDGERGSKDRRYDRAEKENREKERERERSKETMSEREKERERERRRAEKERERRSDRDRRKDEDRDMARDVAKMRLQDGETERERDRRERHRSRDYTKETEHHKEGKDKNRDRERRERHGDREHSGYRESREHRREKEEEERRRRDRDLHGGGEMRDSERERRHREQKGSEGRIHGDRDREREKKERDRDREKRHTEESDRMKREIQNTASGHKHRDHRGDKEDEMVGRSQTSWRSNQGDLSDPEIPVENEEKTSGEDNEEVDYEEDFEDYEEDFEDADEDECGSEEEKEKGEEEISPEKREEIRAIQRAMDEENERVGSSHSRPTTEESLTSRTATDSQTRQSRPQRGVIDFVSAKRREVSKKVSSRQKKRSAELLRLIDLDFSITFSLLDLPPVNEYDMYIKSFGTTNTRQAYVQCNEDNADREVQTEETDTSDKWTQHPAETSISCGGPDQSQNAVGDTALRTNFDSRRLVSFLRSAAQVMSVLLEEDRAQKHALTRLKSQSDSLSFSDGCLQLNTRLSFLHGRQVSHLHFSDAQRQTLLSVHAPSSLPSAIRLDSQSVICVWNIWEPSRPQKILVYESEVCCCCFSPGKATLVFAGTTVGSVVLWDLREPSSSHYSLTIGESDWTLRYPTFSTDAVLSGSGHLSTVQSVEPVSVPVSEGLRPELPLLANQEESLGLSFQLASLDEKGVLNLWVVVELPKSSDAGSQTDLGLRPGGKVKLLHSSSLQTCDSGSSPRDMSGHPGPLQALQLKFLPSDPSHYFIATNMGVVNHGTRHGLKAPPKFYSPLVAGFRPVQVRSLEFCPSGQPHFLVGCDDGSVRLHSVQSEQPLLEWTGSTGGDEVVSVQWALTRPAVFCVLDAASCLHIWDLVEDDQRPVLTERVDVDRVTTMAVFGDPAKQNTYSGIALAKHSGRIEIHYFRKQFTVPTPADSKKLDSLLQDAF